MAGVGEKAVNMGMPVISIQNNLMVPLRFVSEQSGAVVVWNKTTNTIAVSTKKEHGEESPKPTVVTTTNIVKDGITFATQPSKYIKNLTVGVSV
ncbi:stalk domain-containing protein [Saccharibacillus deserti]|uniref:stalk domain-containing protein n=1 Tax=Saccharibacillus deserti TaxID=1634444 RepID=UPI00155557EE